MQRDGLRARREYERHASRRGQTSIESHFMTTGRLLARNSALNLLGQAAPLIVALLTIPPLLRGYGAERFGVLMLVQAAIGYFNLFEFGLGRALTQSVALRLSNGNSHEVPAVARTGVTMLLGLGIVAGMV